MDTSDRVDFSELMKSTSDYYDKQVSGAAAEMYFNGLKKYSFDQVRYAVNRHIQTPGSGRFLPKVADLVEIIEGEAIRPDEIIAAARLKETPLGIYAYLHIGSWSLENSDTFYLKQRAEEVIQQLPRIKHMFFTGGYDEHMLAVMEKYGVSHHAPLYNGMPPASLDARDRIKTTLTAAAGTDKYRLASGKLETSDYAEKITAPSNLIENITVTDDEIAETKKFVGASNA